MNLLIRILCFAYVASNAFAWNPKRAKSDELSPEVAEICNAYWNWRISDMPQYATFVGIHDYDEELDDMSEKAYERRLEKCLNFQSKAEMILANLTREEDIINTQVLIYELETYIDSYHLKGFYLPVNRLEGPQVDMENLFEWMKKESYKDYKKMLERMKKIAKQMDQIIGLLEAGVESNITNSEYSVNNLNETIGRFVVENPEDSPLYEFFKTGFPESFTKHQIMKLQKKARKIIKKQVTPAYSKLRDYMVNDYKPRENIAVTTVKNGKEFYKQLIKFHTSTSLSPQKIHQIGLDEVERISEAMRQIKDETGFENLTLTEYSNFIRNDPNNFYETSEELMEGYNDVAFNKIVPKLPKLFKNIPKTELTIRADPNPDGPSAFYLAGSFDGTRPGVFYVNTFDTKSQPKYGMMTLSLHEGNPGHHLQTSYSIESPDFPFFRRVMEDRSYGISPSRFPIYTYYVEGWALYSEALGFDMKLYNDSLDRYGHYSEEMLRACRLVVDTGMHALNWTRQDAIDFMFQNTASSLHEIENEVDRYITWPGQALAYKMGQIRLSKMRANATEELGDRFDIREFHDIILSAFGPMEVVQMEVDKWVEETKQRV